MKATAIPSRVPLPFANSGSKNAIPTASQIGITPGAASLTDGFPPLTRTPLSAGGVPPSGKDFNGILNLVTAVQQWQSAGGLFTFDSTFSTAVGGYPKGAILANTAGTGLWLSLADDNTVDPDANPASANWAAINPDGDSNQTFLAANASPGTQQVVPISQVQDSISPTLLSTSPTVYGGSSSAPGTVSLANAGLGWKRLGGHYSDAPQGASVEVYGLLWTFNADSLNAPSTPSKTNWFHQYYFAGLSVYHRYNNDGSGWFPWTKVPDVNNDFKSSLGSSGWKKIPDPNSPSGYVIRQWGVDPLFSLAGATSASHNITFPIAFPNAVTDIHASYLTGQGGSIAWGCVAVNQNNSSANGFQLLYDDVNSSAAISIGAHWEAWGY